MVNVRKIQKIRFEKKDLESFLSPLESDVLKTLWVNADDSSKPKEMKVKEIYNLLKGKRKVALTSIAVILDRLYEKKIVSRKMKTGRGGIHYVYYPCATRENLEESIVKNVVNKLIDNFGNVAVSYFNERFSAGNKDKNQKLI